MYGTFLYLVQNVQKCSAWLTASKSVQKTSKSVYSFLTVGNDALDSKSAMYIWLPFYSIHLEGIFAVSEAFSVVGLELLKVTS